jgi:hypothetical protein
VPEDTSHRQASLYQDMSWRHDISAVGRCQETEQVVPGSSSPVPTVRR